MGSFSCVFPSHKNLQFAVVSAQMLAAPMALALLWAKTHFCGSRPTFVGQDPLFVGLDLDELDMTLQTSK